MTMEFSFKPLENSAEGQLAGTGPLDSPRLKKLLARTKGWSFAFALVNLGFVACFAFSLFRSIVAWRELPAEMSAQMQGFLVGQVVAGVIYILAFGGPALCLLLYSRQVARYRKASESRQLPAVFACQRSIWVVYSIVLGLFVILSFCVMFWFLKEARDQALLLG